MMDVKTGCAVLLLLLPVCLGKISWDNLDDGQTLKKILRSQNYNKVAEYGNEILENYKESGPVNDFSWSNCGSASDPFQVVKLGLGPDPVTIPGYVNISAVVNVTEDLKSPIQMHLKIEKKVGFWIPVPCVDNVGSCTYDDVCQLLDTLGPCPPDFKKYGIPCKCPFSQKLYSMPNGAFYINPLGVPGWLENGSYKVKAELTQNDKPVGCLQVEVSLKKD